MSIKLQHIAAIAVLSVMSVTNAAVAESHDQAALNGRNISSASKTPMLAKAKKKKKRKKTPTVLQNKPLCVGANGIFFIPGDATCPAGSNVANLSSLSSQGLPGLPGERGLTGPIGPTGPQGPAGPAGRDGRFDPLACYKRTSTATEARSGRDLTVAAHCDNASTDYMMTYGYSINKNADFRATEMLFDDDGPGNPTTYPTGASVHVETNASNSTLNVTIYCCQK